MRGKTIAALAGRCHAYEGHPMSAVTFAVRVMGRLGVKTLILTNAAGGINTGFSQGALMVIDDHLNLSGQNPLVGRERRPLGSAFSRHDQRLLAAAARASPTKRAQHLDMQLPHGVYAGLLGPSYETPAEIRFLRTIGADAVGMSTVAEAIAARHMGIEVLGLSCITNMAAGVLPFPLDHHEVMETAKRVRGQFIALLEHIVERC